MLQQSSMRRCPAVEERLVRLEEQQHSQRKGYTEREVLLESRHKAVTETRLDSFQIPRSECFTIDASQDFEVSCSANTKTSIEMTASG